MPTAADLDEEQWRLVAQRVSRLRQRMGLTPQVLAHEAGTSDKTLNSVERGGTSASRPTLEAIAKALGLTFETLTSKAPLAVAIASMDSGAPDELQSIRRHSRLAWEDAGEAWSGDSLEATAVSLERLYVRRDIEQRLLLSLSEPESGPQSILLVGEAGAGKTSLLWSLYRQLLDHDDTEPWLLRASARRGLEPSVLVAALYQARAAGTRPVVLFDTIDLLLHDVADRAYLSTLLDELAEAGCPYVASCRPHESKALPRYHRKHTEWLDDYTDDELVRAIDSHTRFFYRRFELREQEEHRRNISSLAATRHSMQAICRHPLTLRMLFVLYAPNEVQPEVDTLRLYQDYWEHRVRTDSRPGQPDPPLDAPDLRRAAGHLAITMLAEGSVSLTKDQARQAAVEASESPTSIDQLVDRGVLHRGSEGSVSFFHQSFFEHAAARGLIDRVGEAGLRLLLERYRRHSRNFLIGSVLEHAIPIAASARGTRDAASWALDTLLLDSEVNLNVTAIGVFARLHEVSPSTVQRARRAMHKDVVAERFLALVASVPPSRAGELFDHLADIWEQATSATGTWKVAQHLLEQLQHLALRGDDHATRVEVMLDSLDVLPGVFAHEEHQRGSRLLLTVFEALAHHSPHRSWEGLMELACSAGKVNSNDFLQRVLESLARVAPYLGRPGLASDANERIGRQAGKQVVRKAWGPVWAAQWRHAGLSIEQVLEEVASSDGERWRQQLNGLAHFLVGRPRGDGEAAWSAFLGLEEVGRRADWSRIVWGELLGIDPDARHETTAFVSERIASTLGDAAIDPKLRQLLSEAVRHASLPRAVCDHLFSTELAGRRAAWLDERELGFLLPFAIEEEHLPARQAMRQLLEELEHHRSLATTTLSAMSSSLEKGRLGAASLVPAIRLATSFEKAEVLARLLEQWPGSPPSRIHPYAPAMLELAARITQGSLERRPDGARLWVGLIEHELAPHLDPAEIERVGEHLASSLRELSEGPVRTSRHERDSKTEDHRQAALRYIELLGWSDEAGTERAMELLRTAAERENQNIRTRAIEAMIRLARARDMVPHWALSIAEWALRPNNHAGMIGDVGRLVDDLVRGRHMTVARELIVRLMRGVDARPPGKQAGIREIVNALRNPLTDFMRLALSEDRARVLELAPVLRPKLGIALVKAAWAGAPHDLPPRLEAMLGSAATSDELEVAIAAILEQADVRTGWPELEHEMARALAAPGLG